MKKSSIAEGHIPGKFGRVVMTIAALATAALIVVAVVWHIATAVQRQLRGQPIEHREAFHAAPQHSESGE